MLLDVKDPSTLQSAKPAQQLLASSLQDQRVFVFVQIYAGYGGLSRTVKDSLGSQVKVLEPLSSHGGWDILTEEGLQTAVDAVKQADHVHIAFPRKSFARSHGTALILRSDQNPEGWGHPLAIEGNEHLKRVERLCFEARASNTTITLENPWDSFAWECSTLVRTCKRLGLERCYLDQCAYGCAAKKPTSFTTDASWVRDINLQCGQVREHQHAKLEAEASTDPELPTGLCLAIADALNNFIHSDAWSRVVAKRCFVRVGVHGNVLVRSDFLTKTFAPAMEPRDTSTLSQRELRELENLRTVGGLRDARKAVLKNSDLQKTGQRLRRVLMACLTDEMMARFEAQPQEMPFNSCQLAETKHALALEFGAKVSETGFENSLIARILEASSDLDAKVIPQWLNEGFPIGINKTIEHTGIFPQTDDVSDSIKTSAAIGKDMFDWDGTARNYESFYEAGVKAQAELDKYVQEGWADVFVSWKDVVNHFGHEAQLTPMACIVKESHGKEKVRLVVDMRRSAVNGKMLVKERVVLPRISDVAQGSSSLASFGGRTLEFLVCDFKDAFLSLFLHPSERPFVIVKDIYNRYIAIKVCAFGLASAPLLWCRMSSMAMRLAQAASAEHESRVCCYIDDPILVVAGESGRARSITMVRHLLLWCSLGFKLSWGKIRRGFQVDWI